MVQSHLARTEHLKFNDHAEYGPLQAFQKGSVIDILVCRQSHILTYSLVSVGGYDLRCSDGSDLRFVLASQDVYPPVNQMKGFSGFTGTTGTSTHN